LSTKINDYNTSLDKKKNDIKKTIRKINKADKDIQVHKAMEQQNKGKPKPITFVEQKNRVAVLRVVKKNWERKIEIAKLEARKARTILRKRNDRQTDQAYNFDQ
jgi:multidrug resistance efflux pump